MSSALTIWIRAIKGAVLGLLLKPRTEKLVTQLKSKVKVDLLDLDLIIAPLMTIHAITLPMDIQAVVLNLVVIVLRISLLVTWDLTILPLPVLPVLLLDLIIARTPPIMVATTRLMDIQAVAIVAIVLLTSLAVICPLLCHLKLRCSMPKESLRRLFSVTITNQALSLVLKCVLTMPCSPVRRSTR
jgi:hypothetical protein